MTKKRATKKRIEGVLFWAVFGLMAFLFIFQVSPWLSFQLNPEELLNNFSKSYPNLALIPTRKRKFGKEKLALGN
jgi:hypothetical protein